MNEGLNKHELNGVTFILYVIYTSFLLKMIFYSCYISPYWFPLESASVSLSSPRLHVAVTNDFHTANCI